VTGKRRLDGTVSIDGCPIRVEYDQSLAAIHEDVMAPEHFDR
jgi:hypothetical protein